MAKAKWITKKKILEAIKNEPLMNWEFVKRDGEKVVADKNCPVCAVGAILRKASFNNREIFHFGMRMVEYGSVNDYFCGDRETQNIYVENLLSKQKYLHALSVTFEAQANRTGIGPRTRGLMATFVEKSFPYRIKLDPKF